MNKAKYFTAFISFLILGSMVHAAELTSTPTDLRPADQGVLRAFIAADATTITVEPITKWVAGVKTKGCFDSPSAFAFITDEIGRQEWISYGTKACSSANVTTLTDVRRGLTGTGAASFLGGTGLTWDAGALIRVSDYPLLFTQSVYDDVVNTMEGSGAILRSQTTQTWLFPNSVTTTERDNFTYGSALPHILYNETKGTMQYSDGSNYYDFGSGSTINAEKGVKGGVELPELFHYRSATGASIQLGTTGAPLVVALKDIVSSSSGATASGRVVTTNELGVFLPSVGGTGTGGTGISSGGILKLQGTSNAEPIYAEASKFMGSGDGRSWSAVSAPVKSEATVTAASAAIGGSSTADLDYRPTWSGTGVDANTLAVGSTIEIRASGDLTTSAGINTSWKLFLGGTLCAQFQNIGDSDGGWAMNVNVSVRTIGATGTVYCGGLLTTGGNTTTARTAAAGSDHNEITVDTTALLPIRISHKFGTSDAGNTTNLEGGSIKVFAAP